MMSTCFSRHQSPDHSSDHKRSFFEFKTVSGAHFICGDKRASPTRFFNTFMLSLFQNGTCTGAQAGAVAEGVACADIHSPPFVGNFATRLFRSPKLWKPLPGLIHGQFFSTTRALILGFGRGFGYSTLFAIDHWSPLSKGKYCRDLRVALSPSGLSEIDGSPTCE